MMTPVPYYCIQCSNEGQVSKSYADGTLIKLLKCTKCNNLMDHYCEYDTILVAINIILQDKKAYRHVLLNTLFENFWKLGIVFLFCESYCFWCFQKGMEFKTHYADFYELETNFYRVLLRTTFSTLLFDGSVILLTLVLLSFRRQQPPPSYCSMLTLWKGLCLCRYAIIFELVPLIWSFANAQPRRFIVNGIFLLSNLQSYEVVTGTSRLKSIAVLTIGSLLRHYLVSVFDVWLPV